MALIQKPEAFGVVRSHAYSRIELDFVIRLSDNVYEVEVKAEENVKAKSIKTFIANNPHLKALRLSMKNHGIQPWIENIPLYVFMEYLCR